MPLFARDPTPRLIGRPICIVLMIMEATSEPFDQGSNSSQFASVGDFPAVSSWSWTREAALDA